MHWDTPLSIRPENALIQKILTKSKDFINFPGAEDAPYPLGVKLGERGLDQVGLFKLSGLEDESPKGREEADLELGQVFFDSSRKIR